MPCKLFDNLWFGGKCLVFFLRHHVFFIRRCHFRYFHIAVCHFFHPRFSFHGSGLYWPPSELYASANYIGKAIVCLSLDYNKRYRPDMPQPMAISVLPVIFGRTDDRCDLFAFNSWTTALSRVHFEIPRTKIFRHRARFGHFWLSYRRAARLVRLLAWGSALLFCGNHCAKTHRFWAMAWDRRISPGAVESNVCRRSSSPDSSSQQPMDLVDYLSIKIRLVVS